MPVVVMKLLETPGRFEPFGKERREFQFDRGYGERKSDKLTGCEVSQIV